VKNYAPIVLLACKIYTLVLFRTVAHTFPAEFKVIPCQLELPPNCPEDQVHCVAPEPVPI